MTERLVATEDTLVRYSNPYQVVNRAQEKPDPKSSLKPGGAGDRALTSKELTGDKNKETQEILNCILPPREWEEEGQLWRQEVCLKVFLEKKRNYFEFVYPVFLHKWGNKQEVVSSQPATRADVLKLGEELDKRLQQRQARETGICAVRKLLFQQTFDELIRQVTVNCGERGLLLLRVRDELRMTIAAYQALYESSVAYGMRKALLAEQGKEDMENEIEALKAEKAQLEQEVDEMKMKYNMLERRNEEMRVADEQRHTEEVTFLKKTNQQLKAQLESIISPKK